MLPATQEDVSHILLLLNDAPQAPLDRIAFVFQHLLNFVKHHHDLPLSLGRYLSWRGQHFFELPSGLPSHIESERDLGFAVGVGSHAGRQTAEELLRNIEQLSRSAAYGFRDRSG